MMFEQVCIIGCGLMGCSFALALKKAGIAKQIVGYSKSPTTTEAAKAAGILDSTAPSVMQAALGADLILLAVPVGATSHVFNEIEGLLTPETLVMDVGSTKQDVVQAAYDKLKKKVYNFVPAHPIAGNNLTGCDAAQADLFENSTVILTPLKETGKAHLQLAIKVWQAIGAHVKLMAPKEHDETLGYISHLPHLLAFIYMTSIVNNQSKEQLLSIAGSGFRDFTRIAASDSTMWRDILISNKKHMLEQINAFKNTLNHYESVLQQGEAFVLQDLIEKASQSRLSWGEERANSLADQNNAKDVKDENTSKPRKCFLARLFCKNS